MKNKENKMEIIVTFNENKGVSFKLNPKARIYIDRAIKKDCLWDYEEFFTPFKKVLDEHDIDYADFVGFLLLHEIAYLENKNNQEMK